MKLCTSFSEPNHGSVVPKHTFAKKGNVMEKGRSEAPRGMLFEVILEHLGRQIVKNGGFQNSFFVCVFFLDTQKGSTSRAGSQARGGCGPFKVLN